MNKKDYINFAKKSANIQINELKKIKKIFNKSFVKAIDLISNTKGKIIFSGVGKNSFVCKKAAATFSSVGIPSFFVDPTGVSHGDAGQIEKRYSNNYFKFRQYSRIKNLLKFANRFRIKIIGIASNSNSMLIKASDVEIVYPRLKEADPNNIVPTTSPLCDDVMRLSCNNNYGKEKIYKENFLYHGVEIWEPRLSTKDIMVIRRKMPVMIIRKTLDKL